MDAYYSVWDNQFNEKSGYEAFQQAMELLWENINQNPDLSTDKVKQVESEYKKLQNAIKKKEEEMRKVLEDVNKQQNAIKEKEEKTRKMMVDAMKKKEEEMRKVLEDDMKKKEEEMR